MTLSTIDKLIFGKDPTERIVGIEACSGFVELFLEHPEGIEVKVVPNKSWLVANQKLDEDFKRLKGDLYYKWFKTYDNTTDFFIDKKRYAKKEVFSVGDIKEASMLSRGFTYFKGMKADEVSVLGFDIESISLLDNPDKKVLIISNTFRKNGQIVRKLFTYDNYASQGEFLIDWCNWVKEINPSIIIGHNIFMYDFPYLQAIAEAEGIELSLGRDNSSLKFSKWTNKFRFDGSQDYDYTRCNIYGREIVDTMFLSMKYDFSRKYENYKLKYIVAVENLEVKDRQFYDADTIRLTYEDPIEWAKIKQYAIHDADDALALYDLMIPSYFYYAQSIPKPFQSIMYSASGSQINSFLIRSYIQDVHSLPKASESYPFEGAISIGNPGRYQNVYKVDVASLYPSIMLQYEVYDPYKDPNANFHKMVEYFTAERLRNKKLGKDTGDRYYKDMEQAQKIVINSAYGMLGATGLLFNSPKNAAFVTTKGRDVLQSAINWAEDNNYKIVNADTDSISFCVDGQTYISEDDRKGILGRLNSYYPDKIKFEDDGYFPVVLVLKAKNYVLFDGKKTKIKGSALKSSKTEKALKEFIGKVVQNLLSNNVEGVKWEYDNYVKEIFNIKDIKRWCGRKTITEKVISSQRTNEKNILNSLEGETALVGEKIYCYFNKEGQLKQDKNWNNDHDTRKLLEKLYKTLNIFNNVIEMTQFTKFHLKNKLIKEKLEGLLDETKVL